MLILVMQTPYFIVLSGCFNFKIFFTSKIILKRKGQQTSSIKKPIKTEWAQ